MLDLLAMCESLHYQALSMLQANCQIRSTCLFVESNSMYIYSAVLHVSLPRTTTTITLTFPLYYTANISAIYCRLVAYSYTLELIEHSHTRTLEHEDIPTYT